MRGKAGSAGTAGSELGKKSIRVRLEKKFYFGLEKRVSFWKLGAICRSLLSFYCFLVLRIYLGAI